MESQVPSMGKGRRAKESLAMRGRKGRLAKLLSVPVLAVCGFAVAATLAGVGLATEITTTSTTTTTTPTTTTTTTTTTTPPGNEGCTPGYWKNHTEAWEGYTTGQRVGDVFTEAPAIVADLTLLEGLKNGGGEAKALTRHAIAALLGAASSNVDFPLTELEVIDLVNDAFASGDFEATKDLLEGFNELGAPGFCD
jgi:hypothetical protein